MIRTMRAASVVPMALVGAALLTADPGGAQSTHVLVVSGLGGAPEYSRSFAEWGAGMVDAALDAGVPEASVTWLAEDPAQDPRIAGESRRDAVARRLAALAETSAPGDLLVLVLFGHGSVRGGESRLNLPGPDLTAGELAAMLDPLSDRRTVVVNAASGSAGFVEPLAGPDRVVITATRSDAQTEATRFGGHFVAAFTGRDGDTDKDGRVSMLEAFEYARTGVARTFEEADALPTEHALLEDNADGQGSMEPGDDGSLAARIALAPVGSAERPAAAGTDDPAVAGLLEEQARLRAELTALRDRQGGMAEADYQAELERLLLEIARNGRALREARGEDGAPGSPGGGGGS